MINAILFLLVGGDGWFLCGSVFLAAAAADCCGALDAPGRFRAGLRRALHFLLVLAMPLAALTGTPLPLWSAVPLLVAAPAYAFAGWGHADRRVRIGLAAAAGACVLLALLLELPHRIPPSPPTGRPQRLIVVADSLSSGGYGERMAWPEILAAEGLPVRDLSMDGATVGTALQHKIPVVRREARPGDWVLVELGGNDMLGNTGPDEFAGQLDRLLAELRGDPAAPRTVVMMELPVPLGQWAFGRHQRELAARHGVVLIPKRVLAGVLLADGHTGGDRIHLTQAGQDALAAALRPWLGLATE